MSSTFLSKKLKNLKPYKPASQEIWAKNSSGIMKLDWNEGLHDLPDIVYEGLRNFIERNYLNYYPNVSNEELIQSIADYSKVESFCCLDFSGIDHLHEYILKAFFDEGDEIQIFAPSYDNFRFVAESSGVKTKSITIFKPEEDLEINNIKFSCKSVYIANPNNPTGHQFTAEQIELFLKTNPKTLFIIDEAYWEYSGITCASLIKKYENLIICRTLSKAFCLAGVRFGYALGTKGLIDALRIVKNAKSVSMFAQVAANIAINNPDYMIQHVNETFYAKKELCYNLQQHNSMKCFAREGNFLLISFDYEYQKNNFINYFLQERMFFRDLSGVPGLENFVRVTIPTSLNLEKFLTTLKGYKEKNKDEN